MRNILLAILGMICGLAIVEAGMFLAVHSHFAKILPAVEPQLGQPDHDICYAFMPGAAGLWVAENRAFVRINSLGLRDGPMTREKPPGVYRVGLTGDSYTEALQVEHEAAFEALAEKKLAGRHVEIANLAMSGYGPLQQLARLEKFGYPLDPDLVIMMISGGDFLTEKLLDDSASPAYGRDERGILGRSYGFRQRRSQRYADTVVGRSFLFLMRHSSIFRAAYTKGKNALQRPEPKKGDRDGAPDVCMEDVLEPYYQLWIAHMPERNWQATALLFREMENDSRVHHAPVIVAVIVPLPPAKCAEAVKKRDVVIGSMREFLKESGIRLIDWNVLVAEKLRNAEQGSESFKPLFGFGLSLGRGHLNYRGHEIYAEVLADVINQTIDSRP